MPQSGGVLGAAAETTTRRSGAIDWPGPWSGVTGRQHLAGKQAGPRCRAASTAQSPFHSGPPMQRLKEGMSVLV
jgi:hypothetical protein